MTDVRIELVSLFRFEKPPEQWTASGVVFHRFVPADRSSAVVLETGHPNSQLSVYCQRPKSLGFDVNVDEQGTIEATHLVAVLETSIKKNQLEALRFNSTASKECASEIRSLMENLLIPTFERFIWVLQNDFGQYWLRTPQRYDSRTASFSYYVRGHAIQWRELPQGELRLVETPGLSMTGIGVVPRGFEDYISKQDWAEISERARTAGSPSSAFALLHRSRALDDQDDLRLALIEAAAAGELVTAEFLKAANPIALAVRQAMKSLAGAPEQDRFFVCALASDLGSPDDIRTACSVWEFRNRVAHEGWLPTSNPEVTQVRASLEQFWVIATMLAGRSDSRVVSAHVPIGSGSRWEPRKKGPGTPNRQRPQNLTFYV